jgi:hypothetical protein
MVQAPAASMVRLLPETEQVLPVRLLKVIARPLLALAEMANGVAL